MELDDMKAAWAELGRRVEAAEATVLEYRREKQRDKSRRALLGLTWGTAIQILIWIAVVATVAPFWIANRRVPHLLFAGLLLHAYGVVAICAHVVQLLLVARTYYTGPVVMMQRRLAELTRYRVYCTLVLGLPWWVLWVPATMVGAKLWWGVDLYAHSSDWILASIAVGLVGLALTGWIARRLSDRPPASPWARRLVDDLSGRSLLRAARHVEDVARWSNPPSSLRGAAGTPPE